MKAAGHIPLSDDATLVAGLAGTALAFSSCAEEEAERWLRTLRLHGQVGSVLQAVGVGEAPLERDAGAICDEPSTSRPLGEAGAERALRAAEEHAAGHAGERVDTADLLLGLLDVYGELMDDALAAHGTTRTEVVERIGELRGELQGELQGG